MTNTPIVLVHRDMDCDGVGYSFTRREVPTPVVEAYTIASAGVKAAQLVAAADIRRMIESNQVARDIWSDKMDEAAMDLAKNHPDVRAAMVVEAEREDAIRQWLIADESAPGYVDECAVITVDEFRAEWAPMIDNEPAPEGCDYSYARQAWDNTGYTSVFFSR